MGVRFDPSGHHNLSGGVYDSGPFFGKDSRQGHGHDFLSLYRDVPSADARRSNHLPALDNHVQHLFPPILALNPNAPRITWLKS
jgi:hypothetical protein